jgi:putative ABC transport system ATP-binding protein/lipoprotein-releasing system ATP-binding protein
MHPAHSSINTLQRDNLARLPSTEHALVVAHALWRSYWRGSTEVVALREATCTILPDDRIALVGRSGSGKSTLLHLLGGLDAPNAGTITWPRLGTRDSLRPSQVAFVFQTPSLLPALTAVENVELPLLLGNADPSQVRVAALEALARLELSALADKLPEELSGGQAQRIAMARALVVRPQLVLADEPTGQLDRPTAQHVFDALLATLAGTHAALIVATHDQSVAERLDQVWRIDHGILQGGVQ